MKELDKYILKKFFTVLSVFIVSLISIICLLTYVIDIIVIGNSSFGSVKFLSIIYYYFLNTVATFNIIISVLSFISAALITMRLRDNNEIIACFSLGISYKRFLKPFFISAVFLMKIMLVYEGWILPDLNKIKEELDYKYFGNGARTYGVNIHLKLKDNRVLYVESFSKYSNVGHNVLIDTIIDGELVSRFKAKTIEWNKKNGIWLFKDWQQIEFDDFKDVVNSGKEIELSGIEILPSDFVFDETFQTKLDVDELNEISNRLEEHGLNNKVFRIEQVKRVVRSIVLFLTVLVGVLFYVRNNRAGNQFFALMGFIVAFLIIVSSIVAEDIALYSTLNLYLVFFLPILCFAALTYYMLRKHR